MNDLQGVNLYLIGMMGAGKTTTGRILAEKLGYRFFDTDVVVEQATGQTIPQIFAESGEAEFRAIETQVLKELSAYRRLAIATGGGIVLQRQNWSYLHHGIVIWLDVPLELLYARLQGSTDRPLLYDADPMGKLQTLLEQRRLLYAQADLHIPVAETDTSEQIALYILSELEKVIKSRHPSLEPEETSKDSIN